MPLKLIGMTPLRHVLAGIVLLLLSGIATAAPRVLVVGNDTTHHRAVFNALVTELQEAAVPAEATFLTLEQYQSWRGPPPALVVTLGSAAAHNLAANQGAVPLLCVLLTHAEFDALPRGGTNLGAVFIEQPLHRYLLLARAALPQRHTIGAILGPSSQIVATRLQRDGERLEFEIRTATINSGKELDAAIGRITGPRGVLLALPDPVVVNVETARTLILGAYHRGAALIGYSQALAKAGALMALHSTPEQFGVEAGTIVNAALASSPLKPLPVRYPALYSVSVNYQVARSLALEIPPEAELLRTMQRLEVAP